MAEIDTTDRRIVDALSADARRSASEVGRLVGLSPPAAKRRIDRLEQIGLIRGYTVADEKRSTTRYMAKVTYIFNPGALKHLLRVANIGSAEQEGGAILLVAMSPSYGAHSPWAEAVAQTKIPGAAFPLVTPLGDETASTS